MKRTNFLIIFLIIGTLVHLNEQMYAQGNSNDVPVKLHFKVTASVSDMIDIPVKMEIPLEWAAYTSQYSLYELNGNMLTEVPFQLDYGQTPVIWFILKGKTMKGQNREFLLKKGIPAVSFPEVKFQRGNTSIRLLVENKPVLQYQTSIIYPPEGVNPIYKREGVFIHPLWSPGGQVLTRIQPPDHHHHYGIWNPWEHTLIKGREVDFWNLVKGQGTVRFAGLLSQTSGPVYGGFRAHQQHIDFQAKGEDQVALNEVWNIQAWNQEDNPLRRMIDMTTTLNCPLDSGILLEAYRYGGGIGYRAIETWKKDNCSILTSEGKTRLDADGSHARWCIVEGESDVPQKRSGILFLSYPANREHPEPMRVWPVDSNGGRGDMYFEFCPIRNTDWKLQPDQDYTLRYRMIVFDGKMSPDEAEIY